jgi:hypothetical protein
MPAQLSARQSLPAARRPFRRNPSQILKPGCLHTEYLETLGTIGRPPPPCLLDYMFYNRMES